MCVYQRSTAHIFMDYYNHHSNPYLHVCVHSTTILCDFCPVTTVAVKTHNKNFIQINLSHLLKWLHSIHVHVQLMVLDIMILCALILCMCAVTVEPFHINYVRQAKSVHLLGCCVKLLMCQNFGSYYRAVVAIF